jgi:uncharacterized protein YqgV (UPF0045/DUF77 family)
MNEAKLDKASNTVQEMSETTTKTGQEEMWTTIRADQEEMMNSIRAIQIAQAELQETVSKRVADIMESVDQQIHSLCEELSTVMDTLKTLIEATGRELKTPLAEFGTPVWRSGSRNAESCGFRAGPWSSRTGNGRKERYVCWQCGGVGHLRRDCATGIVQKQFSEIYRPRREDRGEATENNAPVPPNPAPRYKICVSEKHGDDNLNAEGQIDDKPYIVQEIYRPRREDRIEITENNVPVPPKPAPRYKICVSEKDGDDNLNADRQIGDKLYAMQQ